MLLEYLFLKCLVIEARSRTKDTFHNAIGPVIFVAQCFGIMPFQDAIKRDPRKVHFRWISLRTIVSITLMVLGAFEVILALKRFFGLGLQLNTVGSVTFYLISELGLIFFLLLARGWSEIINFWREAEVTFLKLPYKLYIKHRLSTKIRLISSIVIFCAAVEHGMYITSALHKNSKEIRICNLTINFWENLFKRERRHLFDVIPFYGYFIPILEWLNISMTFCWTFMDVFIMIVSIGLATRFDQIYYRLHGTNGKIMPELFWIEVREHYSIMSDLLQIVDEKLSSIILLSCANNLYFICIQLFYSFQEIPDFINGIYFWFSIFFVIARTLCMLFCASSLHDASKKPLMILRNIPSGSWSIEVQRFAGQVVHETVALSGKRFFHLTRKLILVIAGTIVTYELVLLDEVDEMVESGSICGS